MEFEQPQDAHLAYLAGLHEAGHLLAVGPSADPDGELRGLSGAAGLGPFTRGFVPRSSADVIGTDSAPS
jgi:hypothetical protein